MGDGGWRKQVRTVFGVGGGVIVFGFRKGENRSKEKEAGKAAKPHGETKKTKMKMMKLKIGKYK